MVEGVRNTYGSGQGGILYSTYCCAIRLGVGAEVENRMADMNAEDDPGKFTKNDLPQLPRGARGRGSAKRDLSQSLGQ